MGFSLKLLPPDVLQDIASLIATSNILDSERNLFPFLITCSSIYNSLSLAAAPHLYARIFRVKFDTGALFRRLGTLTDSLLAKELERRYRFLARARRFRRRKSPTIILSSEDLRVALRMTLEDDGLNTAHLQSVEFKATVLDFLIQVLRAQTGVERKGSGSDCCVQDKDVAIALWLLALSWRRADICHLSEEMRQQLLILLRPLVYSTLIEKHAVKTETRRARTLLENPTEPMDNGSMPSPQAVDLDELYSCPPASGAAILLTFALNEVDRLQVPPHLPVDRAAALSSGRFGPTMEDYRAFVLYRTPLLNDDDSALKSHSQVTRSLRHDPTFFRQEQQVLSHRVPVSRAEFETYNYISSFLEGVWEGYYMISSSNNTPNGPRLLKGPNMDERMVPDFLCRTPMQASLSLYVSLEEEDLFPDDWPDVLRGPCEFSMDSDLSLEFSGRSVSYRKLTARSPRECQVEDSMASRITHCLILGQTLEEHEQAWNAYVFIGTVDKDGLITMQRIPKYQADSEEGLGTWVFEGHLRFGTALVGTWRSRSSGSDPYQLGGLFSLGKKLPEDEVSDSGMIRVQG
ncbi:hypothetical protein PM082_019878 [Marasmius tenuissimus]|nr:hypothetical protein PM082_019878 [Marasmius tenuissimus]